MSRLYQEGHRELQREFDTERLADRLEQVTCHTRITPEDRDFIERRDMFFIATADAEGRPNCSYKGGDPGFVRVLDETTLVFPNYDGNGMFLSFGNVLENPHIQMLFIDFEQPNRIRVSGRATITEDPALVGRYPGALFAIHVAVDDVFPNCPRYIHRSNGHELSVNVPDEAGAAPIAEWKCMPMFNEVLAADDPARA